VDDGTVVLSDPEVLWVILWLLTLSIEFLPPLALPG